MTSPTRRTRTRRLPPVVIALGAWLLLTGAPAGVRAAHADESPLQQVAPEPGSVPSHVAADSTVFERARMRFARGRYAAVVSLLQPALAVDSVETAERTAAFEMLGRSCVRVGDPQAGVVAFTRLLDAAPSWTMLARDVPDDERAVFTRARTEWRAAHPDYVRAEVEAAAMPKPHRAWYRQRRFQAGGIAILGLAALVIEHQRQVHQAHETLPDLPGHP